MSGSGQMQPAVVEDEVVSNGDIEVIDTEAFKNRIIGSNKGQELPDKDQSSSEGVLREMHTSYSHEYSVRLG
jgi:hypothetical protein